MNDEVTIFEANSLEKWSHFDFQEKGMPVQTKLFLKEKMNLTGMELSLNSAEIGEEMPFVHRHRKNEELYLFISGKGEFYADGAHIPIQEGTCIRCAPEVQRSWRNTGGERLVFIVVQAKNNSLLDHFTYHDGQIVQVNPGWNRE